MNETAESNQTPASRSFLWIVVIVVHVLSAIVFVSVINFIVPGFEMMFADVGAELPAITQFTVGILRWIFHPEILMLPVLLLLDVALMKKFKEHSKLILMVSIVGGAFVLFSLSLPIFSMASQTGA